MSRVALISLAALILNIQDVGAQSLVTSCNASKGQSYFLEPKQDGWTEDGIRNGSIIVMRQSNGSYDIVMKDAANTFSVREDGAKIYKVHGNDERAFTLVAIYPLQITETYQFTLDTAGKGTLIWASLKNRSGILEMTKGSIFVASCSKSAL